MAFRISGLSPEPFRAIYGLSEDELARRNIKRYVVDKNPGFPDRITMQDAAIGETVLLLNHVSQPAETPYRATHAIFVREGAEARYDEVNAIPEVMRVRPLSLRAFDDAGNDAGRRSRARVRGFRRHRAALSKSRGFLHPRPQRDSRVLSGRIDRA